MKTSGKFNLFNADSHYAVIKFCDHKTAAAHTIFDFTVRAVVDGQSGERGWMRAHEGGWRQIRAGCGVEAKVVKRVEVSEIPVWLRQGEKTTFAEAASYSGKSPLPLPFLLSATSIRKRNPGSLRRKIRLMEIIEPFDSLLCPPRSPACEFWRFG